MTFSRFRMPAWCPGSTMILVTVLLGCTNDTHAVPAKCIKMPHDYRAREIDIKRLEDIGIDSGFGRAQNYITSCYKYFPYKGSQHTLSFLSFKKSEDGARFALYKIDGVSHSRLLYRVDALGNVLSVYKTTFPLQTQVSPS